jgi:hypothetical protein
MKQVFYTAIASYVKGNKFALHTRYMAEARVMVMIAS